VPSRVLGLQMLFVRRGVPSRKGLGGAFSPEWLQVEWGLGGRESVNCAKWHSNVYPKCILVASLQKESPSRSCEMLGGPVGVGREFWSHHGYSFTNTYSVIRSVGLPSGRGRISRGSCKSVRRRLMSFALICSSLLLMVNVKKHVEAFDDF